MTKEATSIYAGQPVITLINQWTHAVIVDGGFGHVEGQYTIWDSVYINNPAFWFPDWYVSPGEWKSVTGADQGWVKHVVSASASANWAEYLAMYGSSVYAYGDDSGPDNQM